MAAMVVLAMAAATLATGLVVVAAVVAWQAITDLRQGMAAARQRLAPLTDELLAEQATLQLETDALARRRSGRRAPAARG